jgi:AraC-like DNA-binding protein
MHPDFTLPVFDRFTISHQLPSGFSGYRLPGGTITSANHPEIGTIIQQEFLNSHYALRINQFNIFQPLNLKCIQSASRLVSFLSLRGSFEYSIEGVGAFGLKQGQFTMLSTPNTVAIAKFSRPKLYECMEIGWSDKWIRPIQHQFNFLQRLFVPQKKKTAFFLNPKPRSAGIDALKMANTILTTPYDPAISRLFLKSRAHEYMLLLLLESSKKPVSLIRLTEKQREAIIQIGEHLQTGYDKKFSIKDLSRKAGMNVTTFKYGFREIYGDSVSRIHMKARMEEALRLLRTNEFNTKQIKEKVGYELTTSFLKHFFKYFGFHASEASRN